MRTNNMDTLTKFFLIAISIIAACLLAFFIVTTVNEGKTMSNSSTTQIKDVATKYSDIDRSSYDNTNILGGVLKDLIETAIEDKEELSIWVKTNSNPTTGAYYNYVLTVATAGNTISATSALTTITTDVKNSNYINPNAQFLGKVYKDANKNIIAIEFAQVD